MSAALRELVRRSESKNEAEAWRNAFFPQQLAFVASESKTVAAICSRRAGKSIGNAGRLIRAAAKYPGEISLYISWTKNNSRLVVGRALMELSRKFNLGLVLKEIDQRLMCIHPNGHYIWLAGAKNRVDFEGFRGYKFAEVVIDEAQTYGGWLREVVEDVLEPSLGDLNGSIALTGTPAPLPIGFFHSVTTGDDVDEFGSVIPAWETHRWTVAENIHFRPNDGGGAAWRDSVRTKRGWSLEHPTYMREYLGLWVKDLGALVYPFDSAPIRDPLTDTMLPGRNVFYDNPQGDLRYAIGVDVGYTDETAFVVFGYKEGSPEIYVLEAQSYEGMIPARVAAHLQRLLENYPRAKIVVDAAAKGYIEEFKQRYQIPCTGSEKQQKLAYVEMLRGDMISGNIKIHPRRASQLIDQLLTIQWKEDRTGIDERFQDDLADAYLYGYRACRTHYRPQLEGPAVGSPAYINAESVAHKRDLEKKVRQQMLKGWHALKKRALKRR